VGWISALPWNQAPDAFRERAVEQLPLCSSVQPGVRAAAEKLWVHGQQYLCVLKYSASFAGEQLHSSDDQPQPGAPGPAAVLHGTE